MKIFLFIIIGIAGGLLGGMGMGGGTLLIPFLTLFTGTEQHLAQSINLLAFIPMSLFALIIHIKNKLVDFKYLWLISLPAVAAGIAASFLTKIVNGKALSKYFGIFLMVLGAYQLVCIAIDFFKDKKAKKEGGADGQTNKGNAE